VTAQHAGPRKRTRKFWTTTTIGVIFIVGLIVAAIVVFNKPAIQTLLKPGDWRTIQLQGNRFLFGSISQVKVAGVKSGIVQKVEPGPDGKAVATVKMHHDAVEKLGSEPSAVVRPNTLLGGLYYISLRPGGDRTKKWTEQIPADRTRLPVEVDQVAQGLQPKALQGTRTTIQQYDKTLERGGGKQLDAVLHDAPGTLRPGTKVLEALQGTRPNMDLPELVDNLEKTGRTLTTHEDQLPSIVHDLGTTSNVLADTAKPTSQAIHELPGTLDTANKGLGQLHTTLDKLKNTSKPAQPAVKQLTKTLDALNPVAVKAVPVVKKLRGALHETRPLVKDLVPTSRRTTTVLNDLHGPVLDRINGPIAKTVLHSYHGSGPYKHSGGSMPVYKVVGHALTGFDMAGAEADKNGNAVEFHPGASPGSLNGLPVPIQHWLNNALLHTEGGGNG
jgi:phospholipid/cholesterol/gamma-HCH transport system substrate-binding protein